MQVTFEDFTPSQNCPILFYEVRKPHAGRSAAVCRPGSFRGLLSTTTFSDVYFSLYSLTGAKACAGQLVREAERLR